MKKLTIMLLATLAFGACTSENDMERQGLSDQPIRFSATIADDWNAMTRGAKFTGTTFNIPFSVSGYRYGSGETVANVASANFFYNTTVTPKNSEWIAEGTYTWPANGDLLDFFAYAPVNGAGITPVNAEGGLQINFTVANDTASQIDLMTAAVTGESFNTTIGHKVTLPFNHALTAVQFVLDKNVAPGTIKQIDLVNVAMAGTLHLTDNTWHNLSNTTFTVKYSDANDQGGFSTVGNDGFIDVGAELVGTASPLLMIPQTFTSAEQGIRVIIDTGGSQPQTLYAKLSSDDVEHPNKWEPGKTVTYKISTSGINVLHVAAINYPAATTWGNSWIKSTYAEGDAVGLYAIDSEGAVQVNNTKLTLNSSGAWTTDEGITQLFTPDLTWFMYSPYKAAGLAHSGTKDDNVVTTAEDFFASGISAWEPDNNQSTEADLIAQDLQIAKGTLTQASTLQFDMAHTMGLVHLSIPEATSVTEIRYYVGNTATVSSNSGTKTVTPSTTFDTRKPYYDNSSKLRFFIVRPSTATVIAPTSTNAYDAWDNNVTANVAANSYTSYPVTNKLITRGYVYKGWVYTYTGGAQTFTAPADGTYTFECWGAQGGGNTDFPGGKGAYVCGDISLTKSSDFYVYVGQTGNNVTGLTATNTTSVSIGAQSWNAGYPYGIIFNNGFKTYVLNATWVCAGGGATDIRTADGDWNDATGLSSRIMVAAGGAGSNFYNTKDCGGAAGAYTGYPGTSTGGDGDAATGGEQTQGGKHGTGQWSKWDTTYGLTTNGRAAFGQTRIYNVCCSGGGGGWYCGGNGNHGGGTTGGGAGGSSYISGHSGCTANATYSFSSTRMIDGIGKEWTNTTTSTQTVTPAHTGFSAQEGHTGNGYARITSKVIE